MSSVIFLKNKLTSINIKKTLSNLVTPFKYFFYSTLTFNTLTVFLLCFQILLPWLLRCPSGASGTVQSEGLNHGLTTLTTLSLLKPIMSRIYDELDITKIN